MQEENKKELNLKKDLVEKTQNANTDYFKNDFKNEIRKVEELRELKLSANYIPGQSKVLAMKINNYIQNTKSIYFTFNQDVE